MDSSLVYRKLVPLLRRLFPQIVWGGTNLGQLGLSFDDGPHPVFTARLLRCLARNRGKATFFVLGKHLHLPRNQQLVRRMRLLGCEVGIHGFSHRSFHSMTRPQIWKEIVMTARLLEKATGRPRGEFRFLRLPRGIATPFQLCWLRREGFTIFTCDSLPGDWKAEVTDSEIISRALRDVGRQSRFIALHDGVDVDETAGRRVVQVVQAIVNAVRGQLAFVTLNEMLARNATMPRWRNRGTMRLPKAARRDCLN